MMSWKVSIGLGEVGREEPVEAVFLVGQLRLALLVELLGGGQLLELLRRRPAAAGGQQRCRSRPDEAEESASDDWEDVRVSSETPLDKNPANPTRRSRALSIC